MYGDNIDDLLPQDDELVRRENVFLDLFNRYSIDEGDDAELADLEFNDTLDGADDDAASGSSFSETSRIEGGNDANDSSMAIDEIAEKLEPVIQKRVNAWPEKGINLQLKRVDPSVSVDEWLKANQESTTTTKKYKKTVVNEENKTTVTTTKHFKTTTKRATFNSFHIPRLMAINEVHHKQILPVIEENPVDIAAIHTKCASRPKDQQATSKDATTAEKFPLTIDLSKLPNVDKSKLIKSRQPNKGQSKERTDHPRVPAVIEQSKQPPKRKYPPRDHKAAQIESKSKEKISSSAVLPPVVEFKRCLRSSKLKENIVLPVQDERKVDKPTKTLKTSASRDDKTVDKPPKTVSKTAQKKSKAKKKKLVHQMDPEATAIVQCENKKSDRRSPLKDRQTNRAETVHNLADLRVPLKRLPCPVVTTRRTVRIQKAAIEQETLKVTAVNTSWQLSSHDASATEISDSTTQSSTGIRRRGRPKKASKENERQSAIQYVLENCDTASQTSAVSLRRGRSRMALKENPPQTGIVIHSPSSDTLLGTKVDNTTMLVTQDDYKKRIHPKYVRKTNVFESSLIPIHRRIVYHPPMHETTVDTDNDSECEDVLLTSYMHYGRFEQLKV